ncbi:unnamed protein product [Trichogramma brassicae]|uniref:Uncharacterized protein n=1 Tax=Trichogramma brassicae TaxID=86971 RepID=A0A6H5ID98_9HYME|nr:unnamed protein product [Trichogramma brassicae]
MLTAELQAIAKPTIPPWPLPGRKRPEISQICNRPIVDAAAAAADISGLWSGVKRFVFSSQTILSRSGSERAQFSSSFASIAYSPSRAYFLCAAILLLPTRAKLSSQSKPKRAPNSVRSYPRPRTRLRWRLNGLVNQKCDYATSFLAEDTQAVENRITQSRAKQTPNPIRLCIHPGRSRSGEAIGHAGSDISSSSNSSGSSSCCIYAQGLFIHADRTANAPRRQSPQSVVVRREKVLNRNSKSDIIGFEVHNAACVYIQRPCTATTHRTTFPSQLARRHTRPPSVSSRLSRSRGFIIAAVSLLRHRHCCSLLYAVQQQPLQSRSHYGPDLRHIDIRLQRESIMYGGSWRVAEHSMRGVKFCHRARGCLHASTAAYTSRSRVYTYEKTEYMQVGRCLSKREMAALTTCLFIRARWKELDAAAAATSRYTEKGAYSAIAVQPIKIHHGLLRRSSVMALQDCSHISASCCRRRILIFHFFGHHQPGLKRARKMTFFPSAGLRGSCSDSLLKQIYALLYTLTRSCKKNKTQRRRRRRRRRTRSSLIQAAAPPASISVLLWRAQTFLPMHMTKTNGGSHRSIREKVVRLGKLGVRNSRRAGTATHCVVAYNMAWPCAHDANKDGAYIHGQEKERERRKSSERERKARFEKEQNRSMKSAQAQSRHKPSGAAGLLAAVAAALRPPRLTQSVDLSIPSNIVNSSPRLIHVIISRLRVTRIERSCEDGCTDVCASLTSTDEQRRKTERERERCIREKTSHPTTAQPRGGRSGSKKNEVLYTGKREKENLTSAASQVWWQKRTIMSMLKVSSSRRTRPRERGKTRGCVLQKREPGQVCIEKIAEKPHSRTARSREKKRKQREEFIPLLAMSLYVGLARSRVSRSVGPSVVAHTKPATNNRASSGKNHLKMAPA